MTKLSNTPADSARKMEREVLQRFQENGLQTMISVSSGLGESTISRLKNDHLSNFCQLLAYAGFKLVPVDEQTIDAKRLEAFALLASDVFKSPDRVVQFLTDSSDE